MLSPLAQLLVCWYAHVFSLRCRKFFIVISASTTTRRTNIRTITSPTTSSAASDISSSVTTTNTDLAHRWKTENMDVKITIFKNLSKRNKYTHLKDLSLNVKKGWSRRCEQACKLALARKRSNCQCKRRWRNLGRDSSRVMSLDWLNT